MVSSNTEPGAHGENTLLNHSSSSSSSKEFQSRMAHNPIPDSQGEGEVNSNSAPFNSPEEVKAQMTQDELLSGQEHQDMSQSEPDALSADLMYDGSFDNIESVEQLYERNIDAIYWYTFQKTGNQADAESLTAEIFTRAAKALLEGRYTQRDVPIEAWLMRIARNTSWEWSRKQARESSKTTPLEGLTEGQHPTNHKDILDLLIEKEKRDELWKLVDKLPLLDQQILKLRFIYDLSHAEIGQHLQLTENASKQRQYRALRLLKAKIRQLENPGDEHTKN